MAAGRDQGHLRWELARASRPLGSLVLRGGLSGRARGCPGARFGSPRSGCLASGGVGPSGRSSPVGGYCLWLGS